MSEEAVWGLACLSGIALAIVGSVVGISAWIIVPVHMVVLMTLFWWSDRCADRDATTEPAAAAAAVCAAEEELNDAVDAAEDAGDFEDLLGDDGRR